LYYIAQRAKAIVTSIGKANGYCDVRVFGKGGGPKAGIRGTLGRGGRLVVTHDECPSVMFVAVGTVGARYMAQTFLHHYR
jgi:hypothetical protein